MLAAQLLPHPLWEAPAIVVARTFRIPYYCIRTVACPLRRMFAFSFVVRRRPQSRDRLAESGHVGRW